MNGIEGIDEAPCKRSYRAPSADDLAVRLTDEQGRGPPNACHLASRAKTNPVPRLAAARESERRYGGAGAFTKRESECRARTDLLLRPGGSGAKARPHGGRRDHRMREGVS